MCPHGPSGPDLLFAPKCVVPWSCGHFEGKGGLKQVDLGIPGYPIFRYSHFMRSMDILNMLFKMAMTVKFESLGLGVVRRLFAEPKSRNGTGTLEPCNLLLAKPEGLDHFEYCIYAGWTN